MNNTQEQWILDGIIKMPSGALISVAMAIEKIESLKQQLAERDATIAAIVEGKKLHCLNTINTPCYERIDIPKCSNCLINERLDRLAWCDRLKPIVKAYIEFLYQCGHFDLARLHEAVLAAEPKEPTDANR